MLSELKDLRFDRIDDQHGSQPSENRLDHVYSSCIPHAPTCDQKSRIDVQDRRIAAVGEVVLQLLRGAFQRGNAENTLAGVGVQLVQVVHQHLQNLRNVVVIGIGNQRLQLDDVVLGSRVVQNRSERIGRRGGRFRQHLVAFELVDRVRVHRTEVKSALARLGLRERTRHGVAGRYCGGVRSAARVGKTIVRVGQRGSKRFHRVQILLEGAAILLPWRVFFRERFLLLGQGIRVHRVKILRVELIPVDPLVQEPQDAVALDMGGHCNVDGLVGVVECQLDREKFLVVQSLDGTLDPTHALRIGTNGHTHLEVLHVELAQLRLGGVERHPADLQKGLVQNDEPLFELAVVRDSDVQNHSLEERGKHLVHVGVATDRSAYQWSQRCGTT